MGGKGKIAEKIIDFLPSGNRLVDLFGGGGAISDCATYSNKWGSVLYNELNPLVSETFKKAIAGEFNMEKNPPKWVSREDFHRLKNVDGYIKLCWSFGNRGKTYLYSKEAEPFKRAFHMACVFKDFSEFHKFGFYPEPLLSKTIYGRKLELGKQLKGNAEAKAKYTEWFLEYIDAKNESIQSLESLQRLQNLERLQSLERLPNLKSMKRLEIKTGSYTEYEQKEGDVVYCDPPYENTESYSKDGFNHKEFYDWVFSRPYQVFFSSYEISDNRFFKVFSMKKYQLLSVKGSRKKVNEIIYSNMPFEEEVMTKTAS